jgi:hypothetical protein
MRQQAGQRPLCAAMPLLSGGLHATPSSVGLLYGRCRSPHY